MRKILPTLILLSLPYTASAVERTVETTINTLQSYPDYGGGDVIFKVDNPSAICKGYWLSPNTKGFNANLSIVLSAYHSSSKLTIDGHPEDIYKWKGSGTHYCKLYSVKLIK